MGRKAKRPGSGKKPADVAAGYVAADVAAQISGSGKKPADVAEGGEKAERVALMEGDPLEATRSFKFCLVQLFSRFDVDNDKLLSEAELKAFSREANEDGREFTAEELDEMREFFNFADNADGVSGLTLRGWLQMYETQTGSEEEETWKDLHNLGYNDQLKLSCAELKLDCAEPKASAKGRHPRSASLRAALERFVSLGEGEDVEAFVEAFVATDIDAEDRSAFAEDLQRDGRKQLLELLAELRCCASGEGVFRIEEEKEVEGEEKSPVTIHFHAPHKGTENIDRAVTFIRDGGEWRAEG